MELTGDWAKAAKLASGLSARFQRAVAQATAQEAQQIRGNIVKGIRAGKGFAPLSPMTLAIRKAGGFGGSKALIRTGALIGAITAVKVGGGWFVGLLRQAKSKGGKSLANVGAIHEFGASWTQPFTAKSRRFLFAMLRKAGLSRGGPRAGGPGGGGGKTTLSITIPARPFIGPVVEAAQKDLAKRFWGRVAKAMGGDLGSV